MTSPSNRLNNNSCELNWLCSTNMRAHLGIIESGCGRCEICVYNENVIRNDINTPNMLTNFHGKANVCTRFSVNHKLQKKRIRWLVLWGKTASMSFEWANCVFFSCFEIDESSGARSQKLHAVVAMPFLFRFHSENIGRQTFNHLQRCVPNGGFPIDGCVLPAGRRTARLHSGKITYNRIQNTQMQTALERNRCTACAGRWVR